jgi:hypothetical protein
MAGRSDNDGLAFRQGYLWYTLGQCLDVLCQYIRSHLSGCVHLSHVHPEIFRNNGKRDSHRRDLVRLYASNPLKK